MTDPDRTTSHNSSDSDGNNKPELACASLVERMRSLQLATSDTEGKPNCGYTPFLFQPKNQFYIFVSQLSAHTRDIKETGKVAIMIIDDEQISQQIYARTRVTYQCEARNILPTASDYERLLDRYQKRQGKMAGLLRQLPDFQLFCLTPVAGQFVMGFGKAYKLAGPQLTEFHHTKTG